MLYFAYGSNLNWDQMKVRCPDCVPIAKATLRGWKMQFRGPLDIEPDPDSEVHGVVFSVSDRDLANLDRYEGYPSYYVRKMVSLINNKRDQLMRAVVYVMTDTHKDRDLFRPSRDYLEGVLQGHEDFSIPDDQVWEAYDRADEMHKRRVK